MLQTQNSASSLSVPPDYGYVPCLLGARYELLEAAAGPGRPLRYLSRPALNMRYGASLRRAPSERQICQGIYRLGDPHPSSWGSHGHMMLHLPCVANRWASGLTRICA